MPKKQKKTHRADGHYYLTVDILRDHDACHSGLQQFIHVSSIERDYQKVPVTLKLMEELDNHAAWAGDEMKINGLVTENEREVFCDECYKPPYGSEALAFMNLLERRAVREGRLSPATK
jgi:hypothetical protein